MSTEHPLTTWRKSQPDPMTQDAVAERLGITRWMVNRIESGDRTPSLDLAVKIQMLTGNAVMPADFSRSNSHRETAV